MYTCWIASLKYLNMLVLKVYFQKYPESKSNVYILKVHKSTKKQRIKPNFSLEKLVKLAAFLHVSKIYELCKYARIDTTTRESKNFVT